jgi:uncharacterized damage-inducible protein DinB
MMVDILRTIVGHHVWATEQVVDRCLELAPEQLELTTPGTYGSIHATLDHMVRGDTAFLRWITEGEAIRCSEEPLKPMATLRVDLEQQARGWYELLNREPSPLIAERMSLLLPQAIHHGSDHRTHVCSILGAHSMAVPEVSVYEYIRSRNEVAGS